MGQKIRAVAAWLLFLSWVSWLGWTSFRHGRFPVVSKAQFLATDVAVIAQVDAAGHGLPSNTVRVQSVIWPTGAADELTGRELRVGNWSNCAGFVTPGDYVLPLRRERDGQYALAGLPRSPLVDPSRHPPQIYPAIPVVLSQVRGMPPAAK